VRTHKITAGLQASRSSGCAATVRCISNSREIRPSEPTEKHFMTRLAVVATLLTVSALAASYIPAHRAASVDPVEALHAE
jgi:hypothetical protein